jgi:hypothetical protein
MSEDTQVQELDAPGKVPDPTDEQKKARDNFRKRHGGKDNITSHVDADGVLHLATVPGKAAEDEFTQVAPNGDGTEDPQGGMAAYRPGYDAYVAARSEGRKADQDAARAGYTSYRRYYGKVLAAKKAAAPAQA